MRHVIVGKGPIGTTLALTLAARGEDVLVLSRSGGVGHVPGLPVPDVESDAVDASNARTLSARSLGADVIYCCANVPYTKWLEEYPPLNEGIMGAAAHTGAVLVVAGNLYGYGEGSGPMQEDTPQVSVDPKGELRADLWREVKRRHDLGELRGTEVRGSDYLGAGAGPNSHVGDRFLKPLLAGKAVRPIGSADQPHSWTYLQDFADALVAAGATEAAWGSPWHVPSNAPITFRELAGKFAEAAHLPEPKISPMPVGMLRALGVVAPMMREIAREGYQFTEPFIMESTASSHVLGLEPTPWPEIIENTLAAQSRAAA